MDYFPFFFDLRGRKVLIVGGGEVASRKAQLLARAGAKLSVVAPDILPAVAAAAEESGGAARRRKYAAADLAGCVAAVAAAGDDALNRRVRADTRRRGVPLNTVDNPALCDFIFPAVIDRSPLVAAVSSGGASPVLARRVRAKMETILPPLLGRLGALCGAFRGRVKAALPESRRRDFWERALDGAAAEAVLAGDDAGAAALLEKELQCAAQNTVSPGEVYLIGAGPGAADLLTFRAHRLLQKADAVVYDRLVAPEIVELARRDAEKIFVGKRRGYHAAAQEDINELLIARARRGQRVARLKGGDPFIFGRGGEEMLALRTAGVAYTVAPGVTAASGCAAAAGIPLTHRGVAGGVRFCAALREDMENPAYWRNLAEDADATLLFYMAGAMLPQIAENLAAAGRAPKTAAAVICAGTTAKQEIITGNLSDIAARAAGRVVSPALLIVGDAAAFALASAPPPPPMFLEKVHAVA
ncbi:MAG: siroheme synthase CysG [Gammaproteobacteria bacterium]